jgi:hypothetical protein
MPGRRYVSSSKIWLATATYHHLADLSLPTSSEETHHGHRLIPFALFGLGCLVVYGILWTLHEAGIGQSLRGPVKAVAA